MRSSAGNKDAISNSKKAEDLSKMLENIRKQGSNKQCFDCGEKGTTYVVVNFGTFVCTRCSGIHRDLSHKVKGIGVCNFSDSDLALVTKFGNDTARNIWLAKFDSKKEKMPDPKDFEAVKKHITAKYKDKKYYAKHSEKEISSEVNKNSQNKKSKNEESSDEESDSESEREKEKRTKNNSKTTSSNSNTNKVNAATPVENSTLKKLTPLSVKNTQQSVNMNVNKPKSSVNENNNNLQVSSNLKNSEWPEKTDSPFFDFNMGSQGNTKNPQNVNKTTATNSLIDPNLFTFTNNEVTSPPSGNNKNNNLNDWGIVWENTSQTTKSPNNNLTANNFEFFDAEFSNSQTNRKIETKTQQTPNNSQSLNLNPFEFNLVGESKSAITTTNTNPKTILQSPTSPPTNNLSGLNQNLNAIYANNLTTTSTSQNPLATSNTNPNKKNYDDLDKYLSDPTLFSPNNQIPTQTFNTSPPTNFMNMNTMNHSMPTTNNNMFMNPQMMQQMQMMMMNPQMQSNPQMMQYMQLMFQNMMANMNMNATGLNSNLTSHTNMGMNLNGNLSTQSKVDSHLTDLNDLSFGLNGINLNTQNNLSNHGKTEDTTQKFDAFKDIYNYSKQSQSHPAKENKTSDNTNFNLTSFSNFPNNNGNSTNFNTASSNINSSAYNPFDF